MNYHKITKNDTANGDGVRVTLWVSGCDHHCDGCHNPQTWNPKSGKEFDCDAFSELFDALERPWISGLTLSGGDPLHPDNVGTIASLIAHVKRAFPNKTIWCYTGYTLEELWTNCNHELSISYILNNIDVLVDGKYQKELRDVSYPWAGSSNQRVWMQKNGCWGIISYNKEKNNAESNT